MARMSCWTHFFPPPNEFPTQEVVHGKSLDSEAQQVRTSAQAA